MDQDSVTDVVEHDKGDLRRELRGWQIFFIVASTIIGEGVFSGDRQALQVAGPAGTLLGLLLMGILAICVMEGVSEFVQLMAVPNALFELIRAFVDEDLAWCCGVAYWYTFASIVAALNLTAANFSDYWGTDHTTKNMIFFVVCPVAQFAVNMVGVKVFGWIESVGGFLKLVLVFGTGIAMYHLYSIQPVTAESIPLDDGFQSDPGIVPNRASAVCYVIPLIAYSFLGTETVAMTAFEARDLRSLRVPSQIIAYVVLGLYAFTIVSELLLISWRDPQLGIVYGNNTAPGKSMPSSSEYNMPVIAAVRAGYPVFASFLNGCYIYSVLSASNSALYVASRTLYGLTRDMSSTNLAGRFFARFNKTVPQTGVPGWAVLGSMLSFIWYPFLSNLNSQNVDLLFDIMQVTGSVMCLIVWACLSLAFIRFRKWVRLCRDSLPPEYKRYDRDDPATYEAVTAFSFAQPLPAWIGLIGSLLVVFVFTTASWWDGSLDVPKFALAYAGPIVILVLWIGRKAYMWRHRRAASSDGARVHGWVVVSSDVSALMDVFDRFDYYRPGEEMLRGRDRILRKRPWLKWRAPQQRREAGSDGRGGDGGASATGAAWTDGGSIALQQSPQGLALGGTGHPFNPSELPSTRRSDNLASSSSWAPDEPGSARLAPSRSGERRRS